MFSTNVPQLSRGDCIPGWDTTVIQFAFLILVAFANFMAGVGAAVYLGKAPRDLTFLTPLRDALEGYRLFARGDSTELSPTVPSISEPAVAESPAVESEPADATEVVDEPVDPVVSSPSLDADMSPLEDTPTQIGMEEMIIDMAAQEEHLRRIGPCLSEDQDDGSDWADMLLDVNEDIQKLLTHFNEVRHLVEHEREIVPNASQACLDELDAYWDTINQQSTQLLVISSEPDSLDTPRRQLATICEGILTACHKTRQSCAAYLANASLERPMVST